MISARVDLCIVVPAYNEERNLPILYGELAEVLDREGISFELLLVDDGSRDRTADVIRSLAAAHDNVRALLLSRNFGHQAAVSVGLQHAFGRSVAVMDADLQDRTTSVVALFRAWESGADVAYAVRRSRAENVFKRTAYRTFYRILARVADIPVQLDSGDFCVMDAAFVAKMNALPERLRFVRGLRAWMGGKQVAVPVDRDARREGEPQYTFVKLVRLALDGIVSFSDAPLRIASLAGAIVSSFAFAGAIVVLVWKYLGLLPSGAGIASIALSVLFLGGLQLLTIGILGEYVGRIFLEVKARPIGVVHESIRPRPSLISEEDNQASELDAVSTS
ncbi:MAG TPA: glycosyltransferase family 2 protein [Gemmatimonadaceae bacterium]|nr:glycosyltransferase family 2 protein [Gemmatimonadaceae bacterium]